MIGQRGFSRIELLITSGITAALSNQLPAMVDITPTCRASNLRQVDVAVSVTDTRTYAATGHNDP